MLYKHIFVFCFIEFLLWCLLSLGYFIVSGFYPSFTGFTFTALFIPGQMFLFMLGLLLPLLLCRLCAKRITIAAAVILGSFFNTVLLLDLFVYSQYRFHISMAMLQLFFGPAGREIFVLPTLAYILTALVVLFVIAATGALVYLTRFMQFSGKTIAWIFLVLCLLFTGYNGMYAWGKFMLVPSVLTQVTYLPWANPLSMNRRLREMGFEPKSEPFETPRTGAINYPLASLSCNPARQKPNILVILIDSWRADSFTKNIMPHAYSTYQKDRAFYFTNHLSGGNATEAGVFSLFYSMPYAYWDSITGAKIRPILMDELAKQGYQFGIYASSRLNSPEFNQNVFSHIDNLRIFSQGKEKWQRDDNAQQEFFNFLDTRDKNMPFFGFLFYDSAHGLSIPPSYPVPFTPYEEDMNYLLLTKNTDPTPYMNQYKNSLHYIDTLLEQVFAKLKQSGLNKNTIVILTGDHGQEINDTRNNFWGHNSNFAKYQTQVPLLIWWPGRTGENISYRTAHYDIVPTLLKQALSCQNPIADYSSGYDLFDPTPRPWTIISSYTNKAIQEGDKISVLNNYGGMTTYDENFTPSETPVSAKALKESLKEFSHFYK